MKKTVRFETVIVTQPASMVEALCMLTQEPAMNETPILIQVMDDESIVLDVRVTHVLGFTGWEKRVKDLLDEVCDGYVDLQGADSWLCSIEAGTLDMFIERLGGCGFYVEVEKAEVQ